MDFSNFGANQAMIDSTLDKFTPGEVFDDLIVTNFGVCFGSIAHARAYARQKQVFLNLASVIPLDVEEKYIVRREYLDLEFKEIAKDSSFVVKNLVAEKSSWINVIEAIWGSVENYIQNLSLIHI